jgi:hypothetical protein
MPAPVVIGDAELTGLLKQVYSQYRVKVQNLVTPLLAQLQTAKAGGPRNMRWGGQGVYFDVVVGRPAGSVFSSAGYFPSDTTATEKQANVGVTRAYTTRQIDGLAFAGTRSKEAAFETIAKKTMEEIREASSQLMQQALHNKPDGVMALIGTSGVTSTTEIVVTSPYGVAGAGQGGLLLTVGDSIAVLNGSTNAVRGRAQIQTITNSGDNATLTLSAAIASMADADKIVKITANTSDAYSTSYAMNGLINITNRGNSGGGTAYNELHGLSSATYAIWNATQMVAGTDTPDAAQPTESDIWDLIQLIAARSGKDASKRPGEFLLMTTPGIAKKLMESMVGQRRFTAGEISTTIKGGYKAVEICGIACVTDPYVPAGTIYLLHVPSLSWVDAKDWGYVEFEGAGPWRWLQGRDAFETTYSWYGNLACLQRNAHGSIIGYTDTKRYTHVV